MQKKIISKRYEPSLVEDKWQKYWERKKTYSFKKSSEKKIFSIDTPPPYISGKMHVGHAASFTQEDIVARFNRMQGKNVFHPFGTDDNGLPTERLVEKTYNIKSKELERKKFIQLCIKLLNKMRREFVSDWKRIGMSCDFENTYSTIDDRSRRISQLYFLDLLKKKRIYRAQAPVIWCTNCQTAIAQADLEDVEKPSVFYDIKFRLIDGNNPLIISTTRPELLPSCVAVFVNPDDERYKKKLGKELKVPLFEQTVKILADEHVDQELGSGVVMCCTFGDKQDVEWFKKYNLNLRMSIEKNGNMNKLAGKYSGLSIQTARKEIVSDLKRKNFLIAEKPILHVVNVHERCKTEMEIINSAQWFVKYLDLKKTFLELSGKIEWHPKFMRKRLENWINNLSWDWCVSRQRHFGVPIPIWYCKKCAEVHIPEAKDLPIDPIFSKPKNKCHKCGEKDFIGEPDVLDTWATSSLTPQIAFDRFWKNDENDGNVDNFIMDLRPQSHDIISTWLFYTMVRSYLHFNRIPWKKVMISGYVVDNKGKKMSKSLGNVVDPREVINKFSADALRLWASGKSIGKDLGYSESELESAQKFLTKLWNVFRFISSSSEKNKLSTNVKLFPTDVWILTELNFLIRDVTSLLNKYEIAQAKIRLDKFFWIKLADNYIEIVKQRIYDDSCEGRDGKQSAIFTLNKILLDLVLLYSPYIPFITEEIYQNYFKSNKRQSSLHELYWPTAEKNFLNREALEAGNLLMKIVSHIRKYKSDNKMSMKAEIDIVEIEGSRKIENRLRPYINDLLCVANAEKILFKNSKVNKALSGDSKIKISIR